MISVCMATHNGGKFIRRQLESILTQLGDGDEVIISDDSSTDSTVEVIKSFRDPRIVLIENQTFFNHVYNFENALKYVRGDIVFFADQDDVWLDGKVETVLKRFASNRDRLFVLCSDALIVDESERVVEESLSRKIRAGNGLIRNLYNSTYVGCCMAFSAELLKVALPFPKRLPMHDAWIGMLGELFGRSEFIQDKLILYRRHTGSLTDFRIRFQPIIQVERRLILLTNLLLRKIKFRKVVEESS